MILVYCFAMIFGTVVQPLPPRVPPFAHLERPGSRFHS